MPRRGTTAHTCRVRPADCRDNAARHDPLSVRLLVWLLRAAVQVRAEVRGAKIASGLLSEPPVGIEPTTYALREPPPTPTPATTSHFTTSHSPIIPTNRHPLTAVHATNHAMARSQDRATKAASAAVMI
jgi:hypothetical protein